MRPRSGPPGGGRGGGALAARRALGGNGTTQEDAETGEMILVDTSDRNVTDGLRLLSAEDASTQSNLLRSEGAGEVLIRADDPHYVDSLVKYFHLRESRR